MFYLQNETKINLIDVNNLERDKARYRRLFCFASNIKHNKQRLIKCN